MAFPNGVDGHGTFAPVVNTRSGSKVLRIAATGAAVILACAAVVAFVGVSTQSTRSELVVVSGQHRSLNELATFFLLNGASMSAQEALSKVRAWTTGNAGASLQAIERDVEPNTGARIQMLGAGWHPTTELDDASPSMLCNKKDKIIALFDTLLKKLQGEELSMNITLGKVTKEWNDALSTWLDVESKYRLTVEQVKEATEGATYARDEYEKWNTAFKDASKALEDTLATHADERKDMEEEKGLIQEILRYIGVLNDVKATEKSIAAGGRDSVIDPTTGISNTGNLEKKAVNKAVLDAKIQKLHELVLKTQIPGATQKLAQIQKLPIYSETEEVVKILKEMIADIATRLSVLDEVDARAQKLVDDSKAKMVEWQEKLVKLSREADKAKEKMMTEKLQREKLSGEKEVASKNYESESAATKVLITPWEREIYVITMIKIKIADHCDNGTPMTAP